MSSSRIQKPKKGECEGEGEGAAPSAAKQHEIDAIFDEKKKKKKINKRKQGSVSPASRRALSSGKPSGRLEEEASRDDVQANDDSVKKAKKRKQSKGVRARSGAFAEGEEASLKPRKRTEEGYRVYRDEDLGWNKKDAGGTSLCPFDCNCCF